MKAEEILEEINRIASIHASSRLMKLNRRIAGELVGGNLGRQVEFDTSTGIVTVKIKF